jgi:hypothetical protein
MAMVTVGTDGFVDYVQVPDGEKFMLGPVSVLRLITGSADSIRAARLALKEFVENGKAMLSVDLDKMWSLLPFQRARYSFTNPLMASESYSPSLEIKMKTASYDTLKANVEMAEEIVSKVAATHETIDRLVWEGKRFDAAKAKQDLLKIASRVSEIAQDVDMAQPWVGRDLAVVAAQADEIYGLFPHDGE